MSIQCPFCDSYDVERISVREKITIPFCDNEEIQYTTYRCNVCEEEGDFDDSIEKELVDIIDKKHLQSAPQLMRDLSDNGITMTYLEKALRLPFRTTSRWKSGGISHAALALLRLIRFSPGLLDVADHNFSQKAVARYQLSRPLDFLDNYTSNPSVTMTYENDSFSLDYVGDVVNSVTDSFFDDSSCEISK